MIQCLTCGLPLTTLVTEAGPDFEPNYDGWENFEEWIPTGLWFTSTLVGNSEHNEKAIVVNTNDVLGMIGTDSAEYSGCCGNSANTITNLCARCLTKVGTLIDDCCTGVYFYFPASAVATSDEAAIAEHLRMKSQQEEQQVAGATIWRRGSFLWFVASLSRTPTDDWGPHGISLHNASVALPNLTKAVMDALNRSRIDAQNFDPAALWERLASLAGVPSSHQFMDDTVSVEISQSWAGLTVTPTRNDGRRFIPLTERQERIDAQVMRVEPAELEAAIRRALEASK